MPRYLRTALPDGFFHVTARGAAGIDIVQDDLDRQAFIHILRRVARRHSWRCHVYCLMTNHYHLVVETKVPLLSQGVQQLSGRHAQRFNERHDRYGHLFAGRFNSFVIDTDGHLAAACQYVLENPVRAGLCRRPEDWPWSGSLGD